MNNDQTHSLEAERWKVLQQQLRELRDEVHRLRERLEEHGASAPLRKTPPPARPPGH